MIMLVFLSTLNQKSSLIPKNLKPKNTLLQQMIKNYLLFFFNKYMQTSKKNLILVLRMMKKKLLLKFKINRASPMITYQNNIKK